MKEKLVAFKRLLEIMDELREKCPWDKKQTFESLRNLTIEEVYELSNAIIKKDKDGINEELGDLFLHLVFYCKIADENKWFDVSGVLNEICEKLVRRHPHVYQNAESLSEEEVLQNWEKLKIKEGKSSVLEGVPDSLPAINKAIRLQEKTAKVGFEWKETKDVWEKVKEEVNELQEAIYSQKSKNEIEEEFGDLLFSLINYSRFLKIDTEKALERTNQKFIKRFKYIEQVAKQKNIDIHEMNLEQMDALWNKAKKA